MTRGPRDQIRKQLEEAALRRLGGAANALPAAAAQSDRACRFLARLDTHLPIISDRPALCAFLDRQLEGWEQRYARFIATEGASEPAADPIDPPQAADFLLTIVGLAARRSALAHAPAKARPGLDPGRAPVRRREHAPLNDSRACSDSEGTEHALGERGTGGNNV